MSFAAPETSTLLKPLTDRDSVFMLPEPRIELHALAHKTRVSTQADFLIFTSTFPRLFLEAGDERFQQMVLMFEGFDDSLPETLILLPFLRLTSNEKLYAFQCVILHFIHLRFKFTPLFGYTAKQYGKFLQDLGDVVCHFSPPITLS